jgi:hypothetical protein
VVQPHKEPSINPHTSVLVPLLLLAAEGKCEIQLLLQYSPEMWKGFLNIIIFMWESEFKCPQHVRRATEGKEEGK